MPMPRQNGSLLRPVIPKKVVRTPRKSSNRHFRLRPTNRKNPIKARKIKHFNHSHTTQNYQNLHLNLLKPSKINVFSKPTQKSAYYNKRTTLPSVQTTDQNFAKSPKNQHSSVVNNNQTIHLYRSLDFKNHTQYYENTILPAKISKSHTTTF